MKAVLRNLGKRSFDLRRDLKWIAGGLGVLLVANLGFYLFLNMPRLRALSDLRSARASVLSSLKVTTDRIERMNQLIQAYDEEVVRLDDFFENRLGTQRSRMTAIQREVRAIAREFRIDPESLDYVTSEVEGTDLIRFQVTIPLTGGYPNLRHFLNRIESSQHLLTVDSVELTGSREGGAMLSLTVKMATYFKTLDRERRRPRSRPA
ncbi:MAG: GspMb/PilO family protein [Acidobacteria bacterium]|nr:GspMb/PilO family protein [Acidobacteriota bacterium]